MGDARPSGYGATRPPSLVPRYSFSRSLVVVIGLRGSLTNEGVGSAELVPIAGVG